MGTGLDFMDAWLMKHRIVVLPNSRLMLNEKAACSSPPFIGPGPVFCPCVLRFSKRCRLICLFFSLSASQALSVCLSVSLPLSHSLSLDPSLCLPAFPPLFRPSVLAYGRCRIPSTVRIRPGGPSPACWKAGRTEENPRDDHPKPIFILRLSTLRSFDANSLWDCLPSRGFTPCTQNKY